MYLLDRLDDEINSLRKRFEQDYNYNVTTLPLPSDESRAIRLVTEIAEFVKLHSVSEDSLIVLYYAGHCGANADGFAEWAA
jgi:hypothetical protein